MGSPAAYVAQMSTWENGGAEALRTYAPDAAKAYDAVVEVRPIRVHDEVLESAPVRAFAEQFGADVSQVGDDLRAGLALAAGDHLFAVTQMVWIGDVGARLRATLDALFGPSEWERPRRYPVTDTWLAAEGFIRAVSRLETLDPTLTELIRLRGARLHRCRVCSSRRNRAAIDAGADDATFEAVDHYATSDLPPATKAALALVDAMIRNPDAIDSRVLDDVRRELTPAQAVEVVLDVARNAANKIAVALQADDPEVTDGVQLFTTDADGAITTL